jgi:hypothetical protein
LETADILTTQESSRVEITNEENTHLVLRHIRFKFIPQGQVANEGYYLEIMKRLREDVGTKGPEIWPNVWILHHDNAPAHTALSVNQFLAKNQLLKPNSQPVSLISQRVTSGRFQK